MDMEELISHFPSQEELDAGFLIQVAQDQARTVHAQAAPMTDAEAELRRDGILPTITNPPPMKVEPMSPAVEVLDDLEDAPPEAIEALLPLPDTPPMLWCETCGKVFHYLGPQRKGLAVMQLKRHITKEHGAGYDTRGKNPALRSRRMSRSMKGLVRNPWGGKGKPKDGPGPTDVSQLSEPRPATAG